MQTGLAKALAFFAACAAVIHADAASAADWPEKPIHVIVGQAAGGGGDLVARLIASKIEATLGQPVIVENRTGDGGNIALDYVARQAPDGYTLAAISESFTVPPLEGQAKPSFDPIASFTPVTQVAAVPLILVSNTFLQVDTLSQLMDYVKAHPGEVKGGNGGKATMTYWAIQMLTPDILQIPYKGSSETLLAQLGNEIQVSMNSLASQLENIKAGKLKGLAVTGTARSPLVPDVPTFAESGVPGFEEVGNSYGLVAPAGTPADVVEKVHAAVDEALKLADVQKTLAEQAIVTIGSSPDEYRDYIARHIAMWGGLQSAGAK